MNSAQRAEADWYRTTLYSIGEGVIATDAEGRILHIDPVAEELCGWKEHEARGKPIEEVLQFIDEFTRATVENPIDCALRYGRVAGLPNHTVLIARDGREHPIADSAAPIRNAGGDLVGLVLVMRDQSLERRAEHALKQSEERFRLLFDRMSEGAALHSIIYDEGGIPEDYVILHANPAYEQHTGIPRERVIGKKASEAYGTGMSPYLDIYARVAASGMGESFHTFFEPLGKHFCVSVYSPGPGQFATVFQDETERFHTENALRASENRYRTLFENMMEGYAFCRMIYESGEPVDFEYIAVNDGFERLTHLGDVIGRRVTEVIPGIRDTNPELFELYGRVAATGNPEKFEAYVPALGIWFSLSVYSPSTGHFVAVFDNVTERKTIEKALVAGEARYRKLFDEATEGIVLTDIETGLIIDCNQAFVRLLHSRKSDVVGRSREAVFPYDADRIGRPIQLRGKRGRLTTGVVTVKGGGTREVEVKENLLHLDDRVVMQSFVRDVSEERRTRHERETTLEVLRILNEPIMPANWFPR